MIIFLNVLGLLVGFLLGRYSVSSEQIQDLEKKQKDLDDLINRATKSREQAEEMKVSFLSRLHQKMDVKISLKNDDGKVVEVLHL